MAAPRAARRRRRHARPRRVAARDRPPDRAAPHLDAARRLEGAREAARRRRKERQRAEAPTVALAGYTNVGKSTLLNALTDADVSVDNRLFETLDPTTRSFEHDGRRYLVTDTVGFIRRLPHQLVEGFAATLEETLVADLVLHVVDASAPDERLDEQVAAVEAVLHEIGADELPLELVVNKIDAVDPLRRRRLANRFPDALQVSALTGEGLDELRARIAERFADRFERRASASSRTRRAAKLAELYALGAPIEEREDTHDGVLVRARLPRRELRRFARVPRRRGRSEPRSARGDRAADPAAARDAVVPARAYAGDAGLDLAACERVELGAGRARPGRHRARGRDPGGLRGLRPAALRARRPPRHHDRELAGPRRLRLPRRAAGRPAQHRRERAVRRRARDADRAARRPAGRRSSSLVEVDELPATASAASAGSDRRRT